MIIKKRKDNIFFFFIYIGVYDWGFMEYDIDISCMYLVYFEYILVYFWFLLFIK